MEGGRATVSYGGASEDNYVLQNRVAVGDLDGDGDDDAVVHIVNFTAGTGTFHLVVPVIDDGESLVAQRTVPVGDRIVMDRISVEEGLIEVSLYDRREDEPFTVITRHRIIEIDVTEATPRLRVIKTERLADLPLPDPDLPDVDIRFDPGAIRSTVSGSIEFGQRQTYIVEATAQQAFTAALDAPLGVWLDIRLDDHVMASATERAQRVEADLAATGGWKVSVVSAHASSADYQLTVEILPIAPEPTPETKDEPTPETETGPPSDPEPEPPSDPDPESTNGTPADGSTATVYLTFDDGPHPTYTPKVLDVLARRGAHATFFVLGSLVERYPDLFRRIVAEGHTVANHTWNHENLAGLDHASFDETITRTQAALGDDATTCLRPPYGAVDAFTRDWAASLGFDLVLWTVDTNDWRRPGAETIAQRIVKGAMDKAIILMHDGGGNRSQTVEALAIALDRLSGRDLRFGRVCV